jgi:hypothetical protein
VEVWKENGGQVRAADNNIPAIPDRLTDELFLKNGIRYQEIHSRPDPIELLTTSTQITKKPRPETLTPPHTFHHPYPSQL